MHLLRLSVSEGPPLHPCPLPPALPQPKPRLPSTFTTVLLFSSTMKLGEVGGDLLFLPFPSLSLSILRARPEKKGEGGRRKKSFAQKFCVASAGAEEA